MSRQPTGVVVLGMHRSGTSAVAGILAKAGFFAGQEVDMLPGASDNSRGFFERFDVNGMNDEFLAELGGTWDNPPPRQSAFEQAPAWQARIEELLEAMANDADGRPLVLKDPRMSLLLPVWLAALGDRFALVVVDRNPLEVAMSMNKRDGRPLHVATALWQCYWAELLHGLAGQRAWFTRYESLLESPAQRTSALLEGLNDRFKFAAAGTKFGGGINDGADVSASVTGELRHQRVAPTGSEVEQVLDEGQLALWHWLSQLPEGWVTLDAPSKLCSQPQEALAAHVAERPWKGKPAPAPTMQGAIRLARHHYDEGGLPQVVRRAASEALRIARRR